MVAKGGLGDKKGVSALEATFPQSRFEVCIQRKGEKVALANVRCMT